MVIYAMMALNHPYFEIENPFRIYSAMTEGTLPSLTKDQTSRYSAGLVKLQRSCIRTNHALRPSISEIQIILEQLLWTNINSSTTES